MTRTLVLTLALAATAVATHASPARADVQWLCRPGLASNPCEGDQKTTYYASDGSSRTGTPPVPAKPPVDCFYVYPTVSNQPTTNATKSPDPEVKSIATYQAQRFSTRCRVFAPLYREVTAAGVSAASQTHDTAPYETALGDVREAWAQYLRQDNHGRGVILIGHSQGSRMLRALIRRDIDPRPAVRDLLVSAIIPGANVTVRKGQKVGGDFAHVPACESRSQIGCVIAYSTFNETPPDNTRFGRTDTDPVGGALDLPTDPGNEVLCTDPTALSGSSGRLESLSPSAPFAPGVISALLVKLYRGPPPSAPTPWLEPTDHYTARCETSNGANVLMIAPVGAARKLDPVPRRDLGRAPRGREHRAREPAHDHRGGGERLDARPPAAPRHPARPRAAVGRAAGHRARHRAGRPHGARVSAAQSAHGRPPHHDARRRARDPQLHHRLPRALPGGGQAGAAPMNSYSPGSSTAVASRYSRMKPGQFATIRPVESRYHESHCVHAVPAKRDCTSASLAASTSGRTSIAAAPRAQHLLERLAHVARLRLEVHDDRPAGGVRVRPVHHEHRREAGHRDAEVSVGAACPRVAQRDPAGPGDLHREHEVVRLEAGAVDDAVDLVLLP